MDWTSLPHWMTGPLGGMVTLWVLSAVLHAMPKPKPDSGNAYIWLFNVAQWAGANLNRINFPALLGRVPALAILFAPPADSNKPEVPRQ